MDEISYYLGYPAGIRVDVFVVFYRMVRNHIYVPYGTWLKTSPYIQFLSIAQLHLQYAKDKGILYTEGNLMKCNIGTVLFVLDDKELPLGQLLTPLVDVINLMGPYKTLATQLYRPIKRTDPQNVFDLLYNMQYLKTKCPSLETIYIYINNKQGEARKIFEQKHIPFAGLK